MVSRGRNKVGRGRNKVDRGGKGQVEVENDQVGTGRGRKYPLSPPPYSYGVQYSMNWKSSVQCSLYFRRYFETPCIKLMMVLKLSD